MIEKFTNDNRLKITILRLRDTSHYDGNNGKHILDSFFHVLDKFIEKYKQKYNWNTYNFNIKSKDFFSENIHWYDKWNNEYYTQRLDGIVFYE